MKIAKIQFPCFVPYNKSTLEIYVSGCKRKCKNCHNPELHDYNVGEKITHKHIKYILNRKNLFDAIAILGGEPLEQNCFAFGEFIGNLRLFLRDKEYWLFTGYKKEELSDWLFENFDYIKIGEYREDLKQEGFPASSNQKLLRKGVDY